VRVKCKFERHLELQSGWKVAMTEAWITSTATEFSARAQCAGGSFAGNY